MIGTRILALLMVFGTIGFLMQDTARANMAPPIEEFHLGLAVEKTDEGPRITKIEKNSVAENAGLKKGDLILAVDRRYAKKLSDDDLKSFAEDVHVWPVDVIVVRDGENIVDVHLEQS